MTVVIFPSSLYKLKLINCKVEDDDDNVEDCPVSILSGLGGSLPA